MVRKIANIIIPIPKGFNANLNSLANTLHMVYTVRAIICYVFSSMIHFDLFVATHFPNFTIYRTRIVKENAIIAAHFILLCKAFS